MDDPFFTIYKYALNMPIMIQSFYCCTVYEEYSTERQRFKKHEGFWAEEHA